MSMDWNGDGKKDHVDRAIDYAIYNEVYGDDKNGGNGKKTDGGDGCGVIIGIALIIFIILLIF